MIERSAAQVRGNLPRELAGFRRRRGVIKAPGAGKAARRPGNDGRRWPEGLERLALCGRNGNANDSRLQKIGFGDRAAGERSRSLRGQHEQPLVRVLGKPGPQIGGARPERRHLQAVAPGRGQDGEGQGSLKGEGLQEGQRLAAWLLLRFVAPGERHQMAAPFMAGAVIEGASGATVTPS